MGIRKETVCGGLPPLFRKGRLDGHSTLLLLFLLAAFTPPAWSQSNGGDLPEGLSYENRRLPGPLSVHLLRVDPSRVRIAPARALNDGVGRETVSSIARRHGALAAVNGGFFGSGGRYDGDPTGILKIGPDWYSDAPLPRGALGWSRGEALISRVSAACRVRLGGQEHPVDGLNRSRRRREAILYTWAFHRSTLTDPGGREILVSAQGRVLEVRQSGDSPIPPGGFVVSVAPDHRRLAADASAPGSEASFRCELEASPGEPEAWNQVDYVLSGTPVLLEGGRPVTDHSSERVAASFVEDRHPRTAVGIRPDGHWVIVVVDGRQMDLSVGMTLAEMAALLQKEGCVAALNLDGGGSSTLYLGGRVVNSPSDFGVERPVSEAIVILPKRRTPSSNDSGATAKQRRTQRSASGSGW